MVIPKLTSADFFVNEVDHLFRFALIDTTTKFEIGAINIATANPSGSMDELMANAHDNLVTVLEALLENARTLATPYRTKVGRPPEA